MAYNDELGGRPPKEGLDWFPLQTKLDSKFGLVQAEVRQDYATDDQTFMYVCAARDVILRMYQQIYDEKGYYYPWDEEHRLLWLEQEKLEKKFAEYTIGLALKRGIFSKDIYSRYQVLTSRGIQKNYISATYKRTKVELCKELLLTDNIDRDNIIIKSVSDVDNQQELKIAIEEAEGQQKKSSPARTKIKEVAEKLVELWNKHNDTRLRCLKARTRQIDLRLKTFTPKELQQAVIIRASDPWIRENNQQSNWDAIFRSDKAVDEWLNRPMKNGTQKKINPKEDPGWLPMDQGRRHAKHHRKELSSVHYEMLEYEDTRYVSPKFTDDIIIPETEQDAA